MTRWSIVLCIALAGCLGSDAPADTEAAPTEPEAPQEPSGPDAMVPDAAETATWAQDSVDGAWSQNGTAWTMERPLEGDGLLQAFADGQVARLSIDGVDVGQMTISAWSIAGEGDAITETITFTPA